MKSASQVLDVAAECDREVTDHRRENTPLVHRRYRLVMSRLRSFGLSGRRARGIKSMIARIFAGRAGSLGWTGIAGDSHRIITLPIYGSKRVFDRLRKRRYKDQPPFLKQRRPGSSTWLPQPQAQARTRRIASSIAAVTSPCAILPAKNARATERTGLLTAPVTNGIIPQALTR